MSVHTVRNDPQGKFTALVGFYHAVGAAFEISLGAEIHTEPGWLGDGCRGANCNKAGEGGDDGENLHDEGSLGVEVRSNGDTQYFDTECECEYTMLRCWMRMWDVDVEC